MSNYKGMSTLHIPLFIFEAYEIAYTILIKT